MVAQGSDDTIVYELRLYDIVSGRIAQEVSRMYDVAISGEGTEAGSSEHSLFDRYGIPRPLGAWTGITGLGQPQFGYLMRWDSLAQRDAAFPPFWADPKWQAIRNATDDGFAIVERIEDWLLRPSPSWEAARALTTGTVGPSDLTEILIQRIETGLVNDAASVNANAWLPFLARHGAVLLGAFDVVIGPDMQAMVTFLSWPSQEAQEAGWRAADDDPTLRQAMKDQRRTYGRLLVKSSEHNLMKPVRYGVPAPMFGRNAA